MIRLYPANRSVEGENMMLSQPEKIRLYSPSDITARSVIPSQTYMPPSIEPSNFAGKFLTEHPKISKAAVDIQETQKRFIKSPVDSLKEAGQAAYRNAEDTAANVIRSFNKVGETGVPAVQHVADVSNFLLSVLSLPFSGLGDVLAATDKIPITREVAKMINFPFEMIGRASEAVVPATINSLPISNQSKNALIQPVTDLVSFAAQIGFGVGASKVFTKRPIRLYLEEKPAVTDIQKQQGNPINLYLKNVMTKVSEQSQNEVEITPQIAQKIAEESKKESVQQTTEEMAKPVKHPIKASKSLEKEVFPQVKVSTIVSKKPSKIAQSIESKAVENKLTKGFSEIAGYDPITIKSQAKLATDLIRSDIKKARSIVRGEKPLPGKLRGTSLIIAMEEHIKKNPNVDLAYELANSPLVSETSAAAQELRLAAERTPDSAAAKLMELKKARIEKAFKSTKVKLSDITKGIDQETIKVVREQASWNKFLMSITC